jgi:hypothetical protein
MAQPSSLCFCSYHSADADAVARLQTLLSAAGVPCWIDREQLHPGQRVVSRLNEAIETCDTAVVCIGPRGLGPWQTLEVEALVNAAVTAELRVVPVLLPGVAVPPSIPPLLAPFRYVDLSAGVTEGPVAALAASMLGRAANDRPGPDPNAAAPTPRYCGLGAQLKRNLDDARMTLAVLEGQAARQLTATPPAVRLDIRDAQASIEAFTRELERHRRACAECRS